MLRIVRSSPSCCPLPRLPLLPVAILRILPLPGALKVLLWIVAILASLVALANAANIISNRHVLPYTSGAVCNKSSVAAMLGVMDNVAPFQGENEFPDDVPFDTYFGEQKRRAEEMARAAGGVCRGPAAKRLRQHHRVRRAYLRRGRVRSADCSRRSNRARTGRGILTDQIEGFEGASADETLLAPSCPRIRIRLSRPKSSMTRFPLLSRRRAPRPSRAQALSQRRPATFALVRMPSVHSECFPSPARSITRGRGADV